MAETVLLNESLGAPSHRALEKLMAGIEGAPCSAPLLTRAKDSLGGGFMGWLGGLLAAQPARRLAYASAAAGGADRAAGRRHHWVGAARRRRLPDRLGPGSAGLGALCC